MTRLLFLATRDWTHPAAAGGDVALSGLARAAARSGHSVTLVATHYDRAPRHEEIEDVTIVRLGGLYSQVLHAFVWYVRNRSRFDAVVEEAIGGLFIPHLAPLYVRRPLVSIWHQSSGLIIDAQFRGLFRVAAHLLDRLTVLVHRRTENLTPAPDRVAELRRLGLRRVDVIPWALDDNEWVVADATARSRPSGRRTVLFLGKFRRYKSVDHVIAAFASHLRDQDAHLVLAGRRGAERDMDDLHRLVRELGVAGQTEFRVDISEDEKWRLLRDATVLVVPAPVEGFSLVALEASAAGLPVVASEGVPANVVVEGLNGRRYPYGDVVALGRVLRELLDDPSELQRMSGSARQLARTFTWKASVESLLRGVDRSLRPHEGAP